MYARERLANGLFMSFWKENGIDFAKKYKKVLPIIYFFVHLQTVSTFLRKGWIHLFAEIIERRYVCSCVLKPEKFQNTYKKTW